VRFLKKNKHFPTAKGNGELRNWLNDQRRHKRRNEKGMMTPLTEERIKLLDDVGFDWSGNPPPGQIVELSKSTIAAAAALRSSRNDDVPDGDNNTDALQDESQAKTEPDYGMSDSNVVMGEMEGLAAETDQDFGISGSAVMLGEEEGLDAAAEMVLDDIEADTDLMQDDDEALATEVAQV